MRMAAYPFDWILTTPKIVEHCVKTKFEHFLNKTLYKDFIIPKENSAGHTMYKDDMFCHKDPRKQNDYDYYVRCVNRFNNVLSIPQTKLFIFMVHLDSYNLHEILSLNLTLKNATTNYKLLTIIIEPYYKNTSLGEIVYNQDNAIIVKFPVWKTTGIEFALNEDNIKLVKLFDTLFDFKQNV
jgi:hypothetical protein